MAKPRSRNQAVEPSVNAFDCQELLQTREAVAESLEQLDREIATRQGQLAEITIDPDLIVLDACPAFLREYHYELEQLVGRHVARVLQRREPPEWEREIFRTKVVEPLLAGEITSNPWGTHIYRGDSKRKIAVVIEVRAKGDGNLIARFIRPVGRKKRAGVVASAIAIGFLSYPVLDVMSDDKLNNVIKWCHSFISSALRGPG